MFRADNFILKLSIVSHLYYTDYSRHICSDNG